jgi:deoxyribodipyrimidine photo-lyase
LANAEDGSAGAEQTVEDDRMSITTRRLPVPEPGRVAAEAFVGEHLAGLFGGEVAGSERFRGGQAAAETALAVYDVRGYAASRNEVLPAGRRGASGLSPYIRHGLLSLPTVWEHVDGGPTRDVGKFRDELLWQEFARHWYARLGSRSRDGARRELPARVEPTLSGLDGWNREMACLASTAGELERDGWLVNQTRMWMSSDWAVRNGHPWRAGEDLFFTHLLDGSRAANRLGWQWTTGIGSSKHYGFSRWQVEKRAPELCRTCVLRTACPIQDWPADPHFVAVERPSAIIAPDPAAAARVGPTETISTADPDVVWLTAESLGVDDPALRAWSDLPVVFTFDRRLLDGLQLSAKRLVFLVETLAELAQQRKLELFLGDPGAALDGRSVAVTHAPVPGFVAHAERVGVTVRHPWRWLARPSAGSVSSFSAWRRSVRLVV